MTNFNDYSIGSYGHMMLDDRRMGAFVQAMRDAIKPGDVVLDIGTGTGIFSFLACQFGASRVYAVEPDPSIEVAKQCARTAPGADRIEWIQGMTTDIDLPERVDVVVGDLHGMLPFYKGNIESMFDARQRHLKPSGRIIPARDRLYARPAEAPDEYKVIQFPWRENRYGVDLSAAATYVANSGWKARKDVVSADRFLAPAARWGEVVYGETEHSQLSNQLEWVITKAGTLHGIYVWFDGSLGDGVGYSNAPDLPELVYGRAFFPMEHPVTVAVGDVLKIDLSVRLVKGDHMYRWKSVVIGYDGSPKAKFDQSTFKSRIPTKDALAKSREDYAPALNEDGSIARSVLEAMTQEKTLSEIAGALSEAYPKKFKAPNDALDLVTRLAHKYS